MAFTPCLLDTNILLRSANHAAPEHTQVSKAIEYLLNEEPDLCYTAQNIVEFWNVSTRPREKNGFGLGLSEADREATLIETQFTLLPETPRIDEQWRDVLLSYGVFGVQVHDARLFAVMRAHGVQHLLTLNRADFARYSEVVLLHPGELAG